MADTRAAQLRRLWLNVHLWIGVGLAVLMVPISLSGALLVWHDEIDAWINPHRYAVSGTKVAQPACTYLAKAAEAVAKDPTNLRASIVRYPEAGWPVRVTMRGQSRDAGARPRVVSGRQIVGWVGTGMLIMSLTGLWLRWPRGGDFLRGVRWTRSRRFTFNLHHLIGFWISIPLAVASLTGVYLAFPQIARNAMSTVAPMSPPRGGMGGQIAQHTTLTADRAVDIARKSAPNAEPTALFLPVQQQAWIGAWR